MGGKPCWFTNLWRHCGEPPTSIVFASADVGSSEYLAAKAGGGNKKPGRTHGARKNGKQKLRAKAKAMREIVRIHPVLKGWKLTIFARLRHLPTFQFAWFRRRRPSYIAVTVCELPRSLIDVPENAVAWMKGYGQTQTWMYNWQLLILELENKNLARIDLMPTLQSFAGNTATLMLLKVDAVLRLGTCSGADIADIAATWWSNP